MVSTVQRKDSKEPNGTIENVDDDIVRTSSQQKKRHDQIWNKNFVEDFAQ